jgi:hypothetical protein
MNNVGKSLEILIFLIIAMSSLSLIMVKPASAEPPLSTSSSPTFTLKFVDNSYNVPPATTSTTDPYTGNVTTTTKPGCYVENKTIEAIITNDLGASYYNFRYKGHYSDQWSYYPSDPNLSDGYNHYDYYSVPYQTDSSSIYTAVLLNSLPKTVPVNGELDVQVQALFGDYRAVPYGHMMVLPAPTYDFYFSGTESNWSPTQTFTIPEASSSPSPNPTQSPTNLPIATNTQLSATTTPSVPEFPVLAILPFFVSILAVAVYFKHRRTNHE